MTLGERIQDLRKKRGYSQEKLAKYLNMSRQAIAKWEQNISEPSIDCLILMAQFFEVNLDYLITGKVNINIEKSDEVIREKEVVVIKESNHLLDKIDIVMLLILILSVVVFIGLFIYALLNPLYWNQKYSFIWWYVRLNASSGTWFRILVLISSIGIISSFVIFLRKRKK